MKPTNLTNETTRNIAERFAALGAASRAVIMAVISQFYDVTEVEGLCLHGSPGVHGGDALSDLDLIVVAHKDGLPKVHGIIDSIRRDNCVLFSAQTKRYRWFGLLTAIYWRDPPLFSCDLGLVDSDDLAAYGVEATAVILKDSTGALTARQRQQIEAKLGYPCVPTDAEYLLFNLLYKIHKALRRAHIWNALEYLSQLRRLYITILRATMYKDRQFVLGRSERDVEDYFPEPLLTELRETVCGYSASQIGISSVQIAMRILAHPATQIWKQNEAILFMVSQLEKDQGQCPN